ncbi:hypothetical protein JZ751_022624 [Albula glossodonta]|uniref:Uncharacterized protein n=1 Tax=Albula glossodonta TaxID=121402 RepID=A0A8T2PFR7_9TELE|nr:hypothetical protein JZ751_022624 [Albula glossodonta]
MDPIILSLDALAKVEVMIDSARLQGTLVQGRWCSGGGQAVETEQSTMKTMKSPQEAEETCGAVPVACPVGHSSTGQTIPLGLYSVISPASRWDEDRKWLEWEHYGFVSESALPAEMPSDSGQRERLRNKLRERSQMTRVNATQDGRLGRFPSPCHSC